MFYAMSYPFIHLYLMRGITEKIISFNQITICISIIIINNLWNKFSDKLYKHYQKILLFEGVLYFVLHLGMFLNILTPSLYYIADTLLFCLVTKNIICGGNKLRSIVYKDENREKYDNIIPIAAAISTLIGAGIALVFDIKIEIAFILSWVGIAIDNVFYWFAYNKYKNE